MSGPDTLLMRLFTVLRMLIMIPGCWIISTDARAMPMTMPRYLPRSPNSIFSAIFSTAWLLAPGEAPAPPSSTLGA